MIFHLLKEYCTLVAHKNKVPIANICKKASSLTELEITSNSDVPSDLVDVLIQNNQQLQALKISSCDNLTQLRLPDNLKSLLRLKICECTNLASIQNLKGLFALQKMEIRKCEKLTELQGEMQESSMSLEFLKISECGKLRSIPNGMDCLNKLSELSIGPFSKETDGLSLLNETLKGLPQLGELRLHGNRDWESLPHQLKYLTALVYLEVHAFGIEALPEWFSNLSSLEALRVCDCEKLRDVRCLRQLAKLERLYIHRCAIFQEKFNESNPDISHIPRVYNVEYATIILFRNRSCACMSGFQTFHLWRD